MKSQYLYLEISKKNMNVFSVNYYLHRLFGEEGFNSELLRTHFISPDFDQHECHVNIIESPMRMHQHIQIYQACWTE